MEGLRTFLSTSIIPENARFVNRLKTAYLTIKKTPLGTREVISGEFGDQVAAQLEEAERARFGTPPLKIAHEEVGEALVPMPG